MSEKLSLKSTTPFKMYKPEELGELSKETKVKIAKARLEEIIVGFWTDDVMMLNAWCLVDKQPSKEHETVGLDTRCHPPTLRFNPNFILQISREYLECVMVQEGFKIMLRHPTTRINKPQHISGLASSVTVVPMSLGPLININGMEDFFPTPEKYGMPPNKYYEDYFRRLMDHQDQVNEQIEKMFGEMIKNPQQSKGGGRGQEQEQNQNDQSQGQGNGHGDQEQEQEGQGQGDGYQSFDNSSEAMKQYFNPSGTNNSDWFSSELFDADVKNMISEQKHSAKNWGKYTGDAMGEIVAANEPKISWKEIIRRFSKSVVSQKTISSRMKMNRRHGLRLPGQRRIFDTNILYCADVSGSVSDRDLEEGYAVLNSVAGHAKITVLQFDTEIKNIETDFKKAKKTFKVHGRGGTNFQCCIDYADEHNFDGIVILTDGEAAEPTKPKKRSKVLWLLVDNKSEPPCDWGFKAHIDRD